MDIPLLGRAMVFQFTVMLSLFQSYLPKSKFHFRSHHCLIFPSAVTFPLAPSSVFSRVRPPGGRGSNFPVELLLILNLLSADVEYNQPGLPGSICFWIPHPSQPPLISICGLDASPWVKSEINTSLFAQTWSFPCFLLWEGVPPSTGA